jgi:hypothetical protein
MRVTDRLLLAASLPLAALAIAGCGGGDDDSTESTPVATIPTTTTLSKDELISQGDAICAEVNAAVGGLGEDSTAVGGVAGQAADLYVGMVESLKRLGTPEEAEGYSELSAAADALSQAEGEVKLAAERGDSEALATAESSASAARESFQSAAATYGFEDCGEGPSAPVTGASTEVPAEEESAGGIEEEAEAAPEEVEPAPETGGFDEGGGAEAGGGTEGGATEGGGGSSGGIGPG